MLFSSVPFLFYFLPGLLGLYALARGRAVKNGLLLAASLVFYAWGEGAFILLLLASIAGNHVAARAIAAADGRARTMLLALGVGFNLAVLAIFKYAGWLAGMAGAGPVAIHLPLGISFFTFQALSYLIDVFRRDAAPAATPFKSALYIALFPQLIAGPIVRFKEIEAQLDDRTETLDKLAGGVKLFILGLAQKVLIANTLAAPADAAFGQAPGALGPDLAWLGAAAYALQIYYDFAGYSNMALGLGLMFGLTLPRNFAHPYAAASFREFWRCWHITLSNWFRDYLYIPLGGSRGGTAATARNLLIVFLLCGLWHGAAWTFVAWGLWHGGFLALERTRFGAALARLPRAAGAAYVIVFVTLGWVLFRADSLAHALSYWGGMLGRGVSEPARLTAAHMLTGDVQLALIAGVALAFPWTSCRFERFVERAQGGGAVGVAAGWIVALALLILCSALIAGGARDPFIYFRF